MSSARVASLWPTVGGFLVTSSGAGMDWYSRKRISAVFHDDTWYVFGGDWTDRGQQDAAVINWLPVSASRSTEMVAVRFDPATQQTGAFRVLSPLVSSKAIFNPQVLAVDPTGELYGLGPKPSATSYGLSQIGRYFDKGEAHDKTESDTVPFSGVMKSRSFRLGPARNDLSDLKKLVAYLNLAPAVEDTTAALSFDIAVDRTRRLLTCAYSQLRHSGVSNSGVNVYREVLNIIVNGNSSVRGHAYDFTINAVVPNNRSLEVFGAHLDLVYAKDAEEFSAAFSDAQAPVYVEAADANPEIVVPYAGD